MFKEADPKDIDVLFMNEKLDNAKREVFRGKTAVFLGSLLCHTPVVWTHSINTAATDGAFIYWNPTWFLKLPEETRPTILLHELWHIGLLHMVRMDGKIPRLWNIACDIAINNMLKEAGYSFKGCRPWHDEARFKDWSAEEIYADLKTRADKGEKIEGGSWADDFEEAPTMDDGTNSAPVYDEEEGDMAPITDDMLTEQVRKVASAKTITELAGGGTPDSWGDADGSVEKVLRQFFEPKVNWEGELQEFCTEPTRAGYDYKRPNRRYQTEVLPSRKGEGRLFHAAFFEDTSGSISDAMNIRFNSEVKHVWESLEPEKLSLIMFDTKIQSETVFVEGDDFDAIKIKGRGGTCLRCVYEWIDKNKPDLVVIFSDLYCAPMQEYKGCPILWICIDNPTAKVNSGRIIHIKEDRHGPSY